MYDLFGEDMKAVAMAYSKVFFVYSCEEREQLRKKSLKITCALSEIRNQSLRDATLSVEPAWSLL
jgi:hypothetical protein